MAAFDDVRAIAATLPHAVEGTWARGYVQWQVGAKPFAWERPLRRVDKEALGASAPSGTILAALVPDAVAKQALLASNAAICFTSPRFDDEPIILLALDEIGVDELTEVTVEAWAERAPKALVDELNDRLGGTEGGS